MKTSVTVIPAKVTHLTPSLGKGGIVECHRASILLHDSAKAQDPRNRSNLLMPCGELGAIGKAVSSRVMTAEELAALATLPEPPVLGLPPDALIDAPLVPAALATGRTSQRRYWPARRRQRNPEDCRLL